MKQPRREGRDVADCEGSKLPPERELPSIYASVTIVRCIWNCNEELTPFCCPLAEKGLGNLAGCHHFTITRRFPWTCRFQNPAKLQDYESRRGTDDQNAIAQPGSRAHVCTVGTLHSTTCTFKIGWQSIWQILVHIEHVKAKSRPENDRAVHPSILAES